MLIDDQSGVESTYDRWSNRDIAQTTIWNGRALMLLEENSSKCGDLSNQLHKAQFMHDRNFNLIDSARVSSQSVGGSAAGHVDSDGHNTVKAEAHYDYKSTDEKGGSDSVGAKVEVSVNDQGKTEASAVVTYDKTF